MNRPERFTHSLVILVLVACIVLAGFAMPAGRRGMAYASLGMAAICGRWTIAKRKPSVWLLSPGFLLVLFYVWRSDILSHSGPPLLGQTTFDLYALSVDGSFGMQPSVWITHRFTSAVSRGVLQGIYEGLPFAMGLAYASFLEEGTRALKVFAGFLVAGVLGVLCYRLLPICGPAYLPFGDQCFYLGGSCSTSAFFSGTPAMIEIDSRWPRNAMPSLHMGWALLIWWSCSERKYQWVTLVFAFLTAVSTMVYGEHYLVDLLAAFFFSLIPWSLCLSPGSFYAPSRSFALATGVLGYLLWIVLIRYTWSVFALSPVIPWAALLLSCAGPSLIVFCRGRARR